MRFSRDEQDLHETPLLKDHAFNRHSLNDGEHISPFNRGLISVGTDNISVKLLQGIHEEDLQRTLGRAVQATIGVDPDAEPEDSNWEEMLKGGLQTALETQIIVFEVSGVSRTFTHQAVRSRRASFHQQSQRASFMGSEPDARMPESVWRNQRAREAWIRAKTFSDYAYRVACEEDISYQDARFALLEGTATYILLEYSIREFLSVYAYRACSMFQWEISHVMRECKRVLLEAHPWMEPYIRISCQTGDLCPLCDGKGKADFNSEIDSALEDGSCPNCGGAGRLGDRCTFQGWERVEGQCDFPWAKEELRTYKPPVRLTIGRKGS